MAGLSAQIPITIITGFLGSGKTTLILNLIPQLSKDYRLALIKNELGDLAIDSQLASAASITGVRELLNGCICCNLVGSLEEALEQLSLEQKPDRFIIETSGSAFPATLAMEVNRLVKKTGRYVLDGVVSVVDVENWKGYEDVSPTAKLQAQYTDLLILNKWELVSERVFEDCEDGILAIELETPTPRVKSDKGWIDKDLLLGLDAKLANSQRDQASQEFQPANQHVHNHDDDHSSEVDVVSVTLTTKDSSHNGIDLSRLDKLLKTASKDEVYRIKALLYSFDAPISSTAGQAEAPAPGSSKKYILNWAFGRWTFTAATSITNGDSQPDHPDPILRMTIVTAKGDGKKWEMKMRSGSFISLSNASDTLEYSVTQIKSGR